MADNGLADEQAQVRAVEESMAAHAVAAWRSADARRGLSDHAALEIHADALTRWSERLRMAMSGDLTGDESWLRQPPGSSNGGDPR